MKKLIECSAFFISVLFHSSLSAQTWESVGPHELPSNAGGGPTRGLGRVNVIRFHPDYNGTSNEIIYAGSSRGGVWKTANGGENWTMLNTDSLPVLWPFQTLLFVRINLTPFLLPPAIPTGRFCYIKASRA